MCSCAEKYNFVHGYRILFCPLETNAAPSLLFSCGYLHLMITSCVSSKHVLGHGSVVCVAGVFQSKKKKGQNHIWSVKNGKWLRNIVLPTDTAACRQRSSLIWVELALYRSTADTIKRNHDGWWHAPRQGPVRRTRGHEGSEHCCCCILSLQFRYCHWLTAGGLHLSLKFWSTMQILELLNFS